MVFGSQKSTQSSLFGLVKKVNTTHIGIKIMAEYKNERQWKINELSNS
jgi:hypothetical protein